MGTASAKKEPTTFLPITLGRWRWGVANLIITLIGSFAVWFLFVDPQISLFKTFPQPFGVFLFWSILGAIFFLFCLEMWPIANIKQPLKGILSVIVCSSVGLLGTFLTNLYGILDPAFYFHLGDKEAIGWTSSGMIVLIGFFIWGTLATNWAHWPWKDGGLNQPLMGIGVILTGLALVLPGYLVLIYPNVAVWSSPNNLVLELNTVIGWYYSVIVSCFYSANTLDNWPWVSLFRFRWSIALGSFVGNFIVGTAIYFVFLFLLKNWLVPVAAQDVLGQAIHSFPAQLGVCVVVWLLIWKLAFGNYPTAYSRAKNYLIRSGIILSLGLVTFVVYYYYLAVNILNEPAIVGSFGGDALLFVDLVVLVLLYYVICFESYGLKQQEE